MANKVILITSDEAPKKQGLEVYRDISLTADLNQANILKSYREVIPMAYLANDNMNIYFEDNNGKTVQHLSDMFILGIADRRKYNKNYMLSANTTFSVLKRQNGNDYATVDGVKFTVGKHLRARKNVRIKDINANISNDLFVFYADNVYINEKLNLEYVEDGLLKQFTDLSDMFNTHNGDITYTYKEDYVVGFLQAKHDDAHEEVTINNIRFNTAQRLKFLTDVQVSSINANMLDKHFTFVPYDSLQEYLHGEVSALDYVLSGFYIKAQVSDTYYEEVYGDDIGDYIQFLKAENNKTAGFAISSIMTEETYDNILLLKNAGEVSTLAQYKEKKMWNPYKLAKLVNVKSVFNSIHNIFTWTPGERIINPEFGSNLRKILYEGITEFNVEAIIAEVRRCISEYEPRANVVTVKNVSTINDTEENTILIDIVFTIPTLSREQFVYSYKYNLYDNE